MLGEADAKDGKTWQNTAEIQAAAVNTTQRIPDPELHHAIGGSLRTNIERKNIESRESAVASILVDSSSLLFE